VPNRTLTNKIAFLSYFDFEAIFIILFSLTCFRVAFHNKIKNNKKVIINGAGSMKCFAVGKA